MSKKTYVYFLGNHRSDRTNNEDNFEKTKSFLILFNIILRHEAFFNKNE